MRGDQARKRKNLELYSAGQKQAEIARQFEITPQTVNGIIKKAEQEKQAAQAGAVSWYQRIVDEKIEDCIAAAKREIPEWSTNLAEDVPVRDMTLEELELHTYQQTLSGNEAAKEKKRKLKCGRRWLQERFTGPPSNAHHGFVIFPAPHGSDVNERLSRQLDQTYYNKVLTSIFQTVQGPYGDTSLGDKKRKQAKMLQLAELANIRHKDATFKFGQFAVHTVSQQKDKALELMRKTAAEKELVTEAVDNMLKLYSRIAEVSIPSLSAFLFRSAYQSFYYHE
jgi:hypothetical protein